MPKRLFRFFKNLYTDLRYGGFLGGNVPSQHKEFGAYDTVNTAYDALPVLFDDLIRPDDVLVDVGCGRGRVINWWLDRKLNNRMIGLELDAGIAAQTAERLQRFANVDIVTGDAIANLPRDGTLFYLYSPFNALVMQRFAEAVLERSNDLDAIRIVYYNCEHLDVFARSGRWRIEHIADDHPELNHDVALLSPNKN